MFPSEKYNFFDEQWIFLGEKIKIPQGEVLLLLVDMIIRMKKSISLENNELPQRKAQVL
jgi:hypothetical protein